MNKIWVIAIVGGIVRLPHCFVGKFDNRSLGIRAGDRRPESPFAPDMPDISDKPMRMRRWLH